MFKIILAYCIENQSVALKIAAALENNATVEKVVFNHNTTIKNLEKAAESNSCPVMLLISDNFLKLENCLKDSLYIIQSLGNQNRLIPVTTEGVYQNAQNVPALAVPTSFDKVSNVIQYMNYWQDKYLELRKAKVEADDSVMNEKISITRAISSEIGELLRYLRTKEYFTFEQFEESKYKILYQILGLKVPSELELNKKLAYAGDGHEKEKFESKAHNEPVPVQQPTPKYPQEDTQEDTQESTLDRESFNERANALINDGIDRPSTLEALIDEIKSDDRYVIDKKETVSDLYAKIVDDLVHEDDKSADNIIQKWSSAAEGEKIEITREMLDKDPELAILYETTKPTNGYHTAENGMDEPMIDEKDIAQEVSRIFEASEINDDKLDFELHHNRKTEFSTEGGGILLDLKKELNIHPDDDSLRFTYATALAEHQHFQESLEQLDILIENNRKHVDAYMLMAYVAEQSGDFMLSQSCLEKVAILQSAYPNIFYKLGILTNTHFKNQKRKALRYFKEAIANDSSNADAYYQIALLESDQNTDFDTIIGYLNQAIEHDPQHGKAAIELAKAYYEIGNRERAFHFYTQACDIAPVFKTKLNDEIFKYEAPVPEPEPPLLNDNGIIVLVTGATSGIGKATAEIFAKNGYRLILTGRRNDRLEHIKTAFEEAHKNKIHILNFDVRDLESVKQTIENLDEEWKNVDILINNAGLASGLAPIHEGDIEDWEAMIDTNIKGLLYMTRAVAPHMVERRKGHIINISSIAGKEIYPNGNVYIASKHAVDALTRSMRVDLYKHNIRVSQVAPGMVEETEFALVRFHGDTEKAKIYEDIQPLKASDVAQTIYFIATRPEYVNIQDVVMMGTQQANAVFFDRSGRKDK